MNVQTYAVNTNDAWPMCSDDEKAGTYVRWEDYAALADHVRQLTEQRDAVVAESVELKSKGRELLNEACKVYEAFNASVDPESGDFIDGQTLHEFQFVLDTGSVNTSANLDSLRAEGVEMAMEGAKLEIASEFQRQTFEQCVNATMKYPQSDMAGKVEMVAWLELFARQLRESKGANHE